MSTRENRKGSLQRTRTVASEVWNATTLWGKIMVPGWYDSGSIRMEGAA